MKKIVLGTLAISSMLLANNEIVINSGKKDYTNSKTKIDGKFYKVGIGHKYENSKVSFNYSKDSVDRQHPMTKAAIDQLNVKKYNLNYMHSLNKKLDLRGSYIKIVDNLAPTDQGKVYGLGVDYKLPKKLKLGLSYYKSDYKQFDVNQYDLSVSKPFKIGNLKSKVAIEVKKISIDGDNYGSYSFNEKNYTTTGVKYNFNYNNYVGGIGAYFGERVFGVLNNGQAVQHHAMEVEKNYMLSFGKKFKKFDIIAKYMFQNGNELPENRDDVDTKVTSLMLKYRF